ncbi:site-specific integrase [Luteolibacter flavescens]|uniref:Site-specific integrase n=1 Tax=Luteolibacter flavescens TaxID=1859460 RepID=A0ABT3FR52_9BACT|nr:site-specific integrase [Luteolibacter flavescens]MCW1886040.1 site-specific integrase [Luteolibacter flavescens]
MIGVSLFRRPNRKTGASLPGYYCSFRITGADGRQRQINRQTGKTTKREAEAFAVALRESILKEAGAGEEKSALIYAALQEAADLAARHELTADLAREFLAKFTEIESGKAIRGYTITQWLDFWLDNKKVAGKPATLARYKNAVARFKSHLGDRAADRLEILAGADVQKFRDKLRAEGRSAKTTNGYLKDIRSCLTSAVKEGLLPRNPASNVATLSEEDSIQREPFTPDEVGKLLSSACSADWRGVILMGVYGGLRLGDAASLKAGNIDLVKNCLSYMPQKTSRKRKILTIPLHPSLEDFLLKHPLSDDPAASLFPSLAKTSVAGRNGLSLQFGALMEFAGICRNVIKQASDGAGRTQYARSFHSLRHTFTSLLANANVSQELRMRLTGHTTKEINDIYTHIELESLKKAIDQIPKLSISKYPK